MHDEEVPAASSGDRAHEVSSYRLGGLAALCAAVAFGLAACQATTGGSPGVASLGKGSGEARGTQTTTLPTGNATQLLDEWAACMRAHGDPNQADPTVDVNKDIDINWNPAVTGGIYGTNKGGQGNAGPGQYCRSYLNAAQKALGGSQVPTSSDQVTLLKYAECMRANGIADFPDPVNGTLSLNLGATGDLNPNSAAFQSTSKLCAERTGAHVPGTGGTPPAGVIRIDGAGPLPTAGGGGHG